MSIRHWRIGAGTALLSIALLLAACGQISAGISQNSPSPGQANRSTLPPSTPITQARVQPTISALPSPLPTTRPTQVPTIAPRTSRTLPDEPTTLPTRKAKPVTTQASDQTKTGKGTPTHTSRTSRLPGFTVRPYDSNLDKGLTVRNVGYFRDTLNNLIFYGEVVNNSKEAKADVEIEVSLYNSRKERLANGHVYKPSLTVLKPGQKAVWSVYMSDHPRSWSKTQIVLGQSLGYDTDVERDYDGIKVRNKKVELSKGRYDPIRISGKIVNTGKKTLKGTDIEVTAALYDPSGELKEVNSSIALMDLFDGDTDKVPLFKPGQSTRIQGSFLREDIRSKVNRKWKVVIYVDALTPRS